MSQRRRYTRKQYDQAFQRLNPEQQSQLLGFLQSVLFKLSGERRTEKRVFRSGIRKRGTDSLNT